MAPAEQLLQRLAANGRLPSLPKAAVRVLELIRTEDASPADLAAAIGADTALTAKLIRYANSAALGLNREVASLQHAVAVIGLTGVKMLALSFSLVTSKNQQISRAFDFEQSWSKSLLRAVAARQMDATSRASSAKMLL